MNYLCCPRDSNATLPDSVTTSEVSEVGGYDGVLFYGTGNDVTIRDSFNVSSITDNGTSVTYSEFH